MKIPVPLNCLQPHYFRKPSFPTSPQVFRRIAISPSHILNKNCPPTNTELLSFHVLNVPSFGPPSTRQFFLLHFFRVPHFPLCAFSPEQLFPLFCHRLRFLASLCLSVWLVSPSPFLCPVLCSPVLFFPSIWCCDLFTAFRCSPPPLRTLLDIDFLVLLLFMIPR